MAKFGQPEMNLGLIPGYAGTQRLSRIAGPGNALYMILTADTISAEDALRIGLVQKITEPDALMEEVMKLAARIASNGSLAVPVAKELIHQGMGAALWPGLQSRSRRFFDAFQLNNNKEGMKAFMEKRKPEW